VCCEEEEEEEEEKADWQNKMVYENTPRKSEDTRCMKNNDICNGVS
jgi:hypothetical protein